jgi:hypothetical protein
MAWQPGPDMVAYRRGWAQGGASRCIRACAAGYAME